MTPRNSQGGFVLALSILILAAVLAAATAFASRLQLALQAAERNKAYTNTQIEFQNTHAEMLFRLAVQPRTIEGIGLEPEQRLIPDGRIYKISKYTGIQLMDGRATLNLNGAIPPQWLKSLLMSFGIKDQESDALLDILQDYIDGDNLRRLNGAEAPDYAAAGLPPPRNDILISPHELRGMLGWRALDTLWQQGFLDNVGVHTQGGINPNTATLRVLSSIPNITPETARGLIEQRNAGKLLTIYDLIAAGAINDNSLNLNVAPVPSPTTLITHWNTDFGWGKRYSITLTPFSEYGPWRVDYVDQISKPKDLPAAEKWLALPKLENLGRPSDMGQANTPVLPGGDTSSGNSGSTNYSVGGPGSARGPGNISR